ncbi:hypothetical protein B4U79_07515 [Dinothrombium tinctorium]|uniref:Uncharacterized protein n=1 Tax=Dinothrombium tinctorium TaxID=1965070 RepID=A0A443QXE5_9ACAR|nr:hypothetical protein B4U79_15500 [Dinothrombium tinctorium]RWS07671.1 hypothetical protein B4U79_07515 [Dinothrombium tinctorium]
MKQARTNRYCVVEFNFQTFAKFVLKYWWCLSFFVCALNAQQRPFYNIAHMVNSIKEINYYLSRGANAIEADVSFSPNGTALYTFHGYPCDCFRHCNEREEIRKYLEYVNEITKPESALYKRKLALLFLDLKISNLPPSSKAPAGQDLADKIIAHLFEGGKTTSKVYLLLSIGHVYDSDFVLGFQNELESRGLEHLNKRIGWDVGLNDPLNSVISMWQKIEVINNIWQGDGRSNCISPFYNLGRLTQILQRRDELNMMVDDKYIDKVYHWTIDLTQNLRASLRTGVDGIITNHPERLVNILREVEFVDLIRLADQDDDPFERFITRRAESIPSPASNSNQPLAVRIFSGLNDLLSSFNKYLRDFVFLRVAGNHSLSKRHAIQKRSHHQHRSTLIKL